MDYAALVQDFVYRRRASGVSQSAISKASGIPQGEISRLERRLSNPTISTLTRLIDCLNQLTSVHGKASGPAPRSISPVRPLQQNLPLLDSNLTWERFEEFCRDFISRRPGVQRVSTYGRKGSKQQGIDFPAVMDSGQTWSFQCKQVKEFSANQLKKVVAKDRFQAEKHVVLIACQAGATVRDVERALVNWEVWDVSDISRMVRQLSPQAQRSLVTSHFGPFVQQAFVGVKGPAAFRTWDEHFEPYLREGQLFHHRTPLIGRQDVVTELERFIDNPAAAVAVLPGRGGIGKTRVLQSFGEWHLQQRRGFHLLYSDEQTPFTAETLSDIPADATTLVIDDAHRRDDLGVLLSFAARWQYPLKVVLSIRPEGRDRIASLLAESAVGSSDVIWLPDLGELPRDQGIELAGAALGEELGFLRHDLFRATWDCPLVTIVAAELLRQKRIPPELLEQDDAFRRVVLDKFANAALGRLGDRIDHALAARTLELVAALQPIRPTDDTLIEMAAMFLNTHKDHLIRMLDALEEAGVLLRRGYQLRIVPDVLADHLLYRACLTSTGQSTGYVDRVFATFHSVAVDRLLANVAELDWRVEATGGSSTQLLDRMWGVFETEFRAGSNKRQSELLRMIRDAAVYQPRRVLQLVEWSVEHPSDVLDDPEEPSIFRQTREDVVHLLAELADRSAHGGHVKQAADLLWRLGRDDPRPMNQFPSHPVRLLAELASYDISKPLDFHEAVLDAAMGWLGELDVHDHFRSPLDVLDSLLAKNRLAHSSDGLSVNLTPISVNQATTAHLRARVLQVVEGLVSKGGARVALRSVETLEGVLHDPVPYLGIRITTEEISAWENEQVIALTILRKAMPRQDLPLVQLAVADTVAWTAGHGQSQALRDQARAIRAQLPDTFATRMLAALTRPWGRDSDLGSGDVEALERLRAERMQRAADELAESKPSAGLLISFLEECLFQCQEAAVKVDAGYLTGLMAERHPQLALATAAVIAAAPGHSLEFVFAQFLMGARRADPQRAVDIAALAVKGGSKTAALGVGFLYSYRIWRDSTIPGDLEVLLDLLRSDEDDVRASGITGLQAIPDLDPQSGKRLVLGTLVGVSTRIAQALAEALYPEHSTLFAAMTEADLRQLAAKFELLPDLEEYHIRLLLRRLAGTVPDSVLEMLLSRIDALERIGGMTAFQPVPHNWSGESIWEGVAIADRSRLLSKVRDAASVKTWPRMTVLPDLFADLTPPDWSLAISVLDEWLGSGDPDRLLAAARLMSRFRSDFVFERREVVERTLIAAEGFGPETAKAVRNDLAASARSGPKRGRVLQPAIEDVQLIERAKEAAAQYPQGGPTRMFYDNLIADTQSMVEHIAKIDEEMIGGPLPVPSDS